MAVELNERQEMFCQAYVFECKGNGTEAAIKAGYSENRKSAGEHASRLSRNVKINARFAELKMERLKINGFDKDMLKNACIEELLNVATSRLTNYVQLSPDAGDPQREEVLKDIAAAHGGQMSLDFGGMLITPLYALTDEEEGPLKTIKFGKHGLELEMHDKIAAIKLLSEIAGFKEADGAVSVNISAAGVVHKIEERRQANA